MFEMCEKNSSRQASVRERYFHLGARDRKVVREPESGGRALLPCPMAHATTRHARAVSRARAIAARTPSSFRALATRLATGPRSAWKTMAGRSRALFASRNGTKRHDLAIFASHFRGRMHLKKKCHLESGLYQRDEDPHEFSTTQAPMSPRGKSLSGVSFNCLLTAMHVWTPPAVGPCSRRNFISRAI